MSNCPRSSQVGRGTIVRRIGQQMSEEVFGALIKYVQMRCQVEEFFVRYRNESLELSRRARELQTEWTRSEPYSRDQIRAWRAIPRFESYVGEAQKIVTPSNERQSHEIQEVKNRIQSLQEGSQQNLVPLLDQLYENDERRLTSDIAPMFELLEEARSYIDQGEALLREIIAGRKPKRFWKT